MKTVVQQIIEKFENIQKNDCKTLPEVVFFDGVLAILETVFLDIEREQAIGFHVECVKQGTIKENEIEFSEEDRVLVNEQALIFYNQYFS